MSYSEEYESKKSNMIALSIFLSTTLVLGILFMNDFNIELSTVYLPVAVSLGAAPYIIFQYLEFSRVKSIEKQFPELLRILSEAQRSGINLIDAFKSAEKSANGQFKIEVAKMQSQLSWGIPFPKVVKMFEDRSNSVFVKRMMTVVMEAYNSGGDIAEAMESVASNANVIKELEEERSSKLYQQVIVMYVIFFIFLGMVIVLQKILGPMFLMQTTASQQGGGFLGGDESLPPSYYRNMFFNMVMIQAIFTGLIAGQLGEGKVVAGAKHSVIMLLVGLAIFTLVIPPDQLLIDLYEPASSIPPGENLHLQGSAYHSDGTPVVDAIITVDVADYVDRWENKDKSQFERSVPLPTEQGIYTVRVTVEDKTGKKQEGRIQVVVGED